MLPSLLKYNMLELNNTCEQNVFFKHGAVQVKYNLLENFAFKNLWKREKGLSLQKFFQIFFIRYLKKGL